MKSNIVTHELYLNEGSSKNAKDDDLEEQEVMRCFFVTETSAENFTANYFSVQNITSPNRKSIEDT